MLQSEASPSPNFYFFVLVVIFPVTKFGREASTGSAWHERKQFSSFRDRYAVSPGHTSRDFLWTFSELPRHVLTENTDDALNLTRTVCPATLSDSVFVANFSATGRTRSFWENLVSALSFSVCRLLAAFRVRRRWTFGTATKAYGVKVGGPRGGCKYLRDDRLYRPRKSPQKPKRAKHMDAAQTHQARWG